MSNSLTNWLINWLNVSLGKKKKIISFVSISGDTFLVTEVLWFENIPNFCHTSPSAFSDEQVQFQTIQQKLLLIILSLYINIFFL